MSASPARDLEADAEVAQDLGDPENQADPDDPNQQGQQDLGSFYEIDVKEQDRWLPIANVARIMKTALPDNAKIAKEAKECMQECVSEFISFITSEAAEKCQQEKRKTVNGEDILFAMTSLGFENYGEALKIYLARFREAIATKNTEHQAQQANRHSVASSGGGAQHVDSQKGSSPTQSRAGMPSTGMIPSQMGGPITVASIGDGVLYPGLGVDPGQTVPGMANAAQLGYGDPGHGVPIPPGFPGGVGLDPDGTYGGYPGPGAEY